MLQDNNEHQQEQNNNKTKSTNPKQLNPTKLLSLYSHTLHACQIDELTRRTDQEHDEYGHDVYDHLDGLFPVHVGMVVEGDAVPQERDQRRHVVEHYGTRVWGRGKKRVDMGWV